MKEQMQTLFGERYGREVKELKGERQRQKITNRQFIEHFLCEFITIF